MDGCQVILKIAYSKDRKTKRKNTTNQNQESDSQGHLDTIFNIIKYFERRLEAAA